MSDLGETTVAVSGCQEKPPDRLFKWVLSGFGGFGGFGRRERSWEKIMGLCIGRLNGSFVQIHIRLPGDPDLRSLSFPRSELVALLAQEKHGSEAYLCVETDERSDLAYKEWQQS